MNAVTALGRPEGLHYRAGVAADMIFEEGNAAPHILEQARVLPADLIVMGTHGVSEFERLMLGSVAEKVLRKALTRPSTMESSR